MAPPISLLRLLAPGLALLLAACSASCSQNPGAGSAGGDARGAAVEPPAAGSPREDSEIPPATAPPEALADGELVEAEVATVGWDGLSNSPIVLVRDLASGKVVPIWVGVAEARAIAAALHGVEFPRPMTHDLMRDLVAGLGAAVEEVHIHDIRDGTYYGLLKLRVNGKSEPLLVDTRPSDGMALALRTGAVLRLARRVLDETPDFDFLAPEPGEQVVRSLGLTVVAPTEALREEFSLPDRPGVVVTSALGEAASQGMRRGDLIVSINGEVPETPIDFLDGVRSAPAAAPVAVLYWRDGEEHEVQLLPQLLAEPEDGPKQIA